MARTARSLATLDRLQTYRATSSTGYDTRTLETPPPNLRLHRRQRQPAGHILVLATGLQEVRHSKDRPLRTIHRPRRNARRSRRGSTRSSWQLRYPRQNSPPSETNSTSPPPPSPPSTSPYKRLASTPATSTPPSPPPRKLTSWLRAFQSQAHNALDELIHLAPWLELSEPSESLWAEGPPHTPSASRNSAPTSAISTKPPTLADLARLELTIVPILDATLAENPTSLPTEGRDWLTRLHASLIQAAERATHRLTEARQLATRCTEWANIDYEFLYDRDRHLLAIGYNVADRPPRRQLL